MTDRLRLGFIGCGLIANSHATNLAVVDEVELVAVHDIDQDRARSFADRHGRGRTMAVASPEAVIEASDAVYVCTWTSAHPELVEAAAGAGRAVFCEKPLAMTLAEAISMTAVVERTGVVNQVGLVLRNSPSFRWLRHQITTSDPGPLMNIVFRDDQYLPVQGLYGSTWRADRIRAGAGTLLEHSIHDLDLLRWIMGPIRQVSARVGYLHGLEGIEDQASVLLESHIGAQATLVSIWHDIMTRPSQRRVEIFCQRAVFTLAGDWHGPVTIERSPIRDEGGSPAGSPTTTGSTAGSGVTSSIEAADLVEAATAVDGLGVNPDAAFVDAVRSGRRAYPDFSVALEAHRLADAAYRSASNGGLPVELD